MKLARILSAVLACTLLIVGGCSGGESTDDSTSNAVTSLEGEVEADGLHLESESVTVSAGADVAPAGTQFRLTTMALPNDVAGQEDLTSLAAFTIAFEDGIQPASPVTVAWTVDVVPEEDPVFLTRADADSPWEGLPVTVDGTTLSVEMGHFSEGFFGWFSGLKDRFLEEVLKFLSLRYDKPEDCPDAQDVDGTIYEVSASGDGVYACLHQNSGVPYFSLLPNSPFVWELTSDGQTAIGEQATSGISTAQMLTIAIFDFAVGYDYEAKTILVPGGETHIRLVPGADSYRVNADVSALLGLIGVVVGVVDALPGVALPAESWRAAAECAAGIIETANDFDQDPREAGDLLREVLGCVGSATKTVAGMVIGGIASLIPILLGQIVGAIGEFTGANHITVDASATEPGGGWNDLDPSDLTGVLSPMDYESLVPDRVGFGVRFDGPNDLTMCVIGPDIASCIVATGGLIECDEYGLASMVSTDGAGVSSECIGEGIPLADELVILSDGDRVTWGAASCTLSSDKLTCSDNESNHSFTIDRDGVAAA